MSPVSKLSRDDYTVGWICALPLEMAAAKAMLDDVHADLPALQNDYNTYILGRIGAHNIVVTCLPAGVYGTTSAAAVATQMLSSFKLIRFGLMVGIGGGVPSREADIRLGDIVVSMPTANYGGVVQYDYGTTGQDGHFKRTGALNKPPQVLLTAVSKLQADHMVEASRIPAFLSQMVAKYPTMMSKFTHRGQEQDLLFEAKYNHLWPESPCDRCDASRLVARSTRVGNNPLVHYGLIASGNQVMKDSGTRDRLARELGILCFEMEAAGLINNFPCLAIRGISDYADSHKDKQWQGYAAATAAAYAKELLSVIPANQVAKTPTADAEQLSKLTDWLTPIDYAPQQSYFINRRQEGTGQWLLNSSEFQEWLNESKQTLFCPGIPGAGKTIITSIVVDHLCTRFQNNASVGIAYVYCNYQQQQEQGPADILASLLKQLIQERPPAPNSIKTLYERHKAKRTRPSCDEILKELKSVVPGYSRVFILIDALDECRASNTRRLLSEIFDIQTMTGANLFATSRFIPEIVKEFEGSISLKICASDEDVLRYLDRQIPQLLRSGISRYADLQDMIRKEMLKAVNGMFLLAQLHMEFLMTQPTRGHIKEALQNLPKGTAGLDKTYKRAMKRIEDQEKSYRDLAKLILSWVVHARRPLSISELQHALAVRAGMAKLDEYFVPEVEVLGSICAGLVTVDEQSNTIRLVHYTTQKYFERTGISWFPRAQMDITKTCVTYLSFDVFAVGFCQTDKDFEERLQLNAFYDYAARNWGHHARAAVAEMDESILNFLKNEAKVSASSQAMMASGSDDGHSQRVPRQMTGVHLTAYFGLRQAMLALLESGHHPDLKDTGYGQTPLWWAARNGHEAVVKLLLADDRVDPDSKDIEYGRKPLSWAAGNGHEAVVKLLLADDRVDPDSKDTESGWVLWSWAAENGSDTVVKLLLADDRVDPDSKDKPGQTPLSWAAQNGHEAVVKLLLADDRVNPDSRDKSSWTPLSWAAGNGHEAVVKLLLADDRVDPGSKDMFGQTPLLWAAQNGHEAVVKLLLADDRVNPDPKDKYSRTPLWRAAEYGHEAVVKLLLADDRANPDPKDKSGRTPLWWAAGNGHEAVVKLLLADDRLDPDSKVIKYGRTPLWWAAEYGHEAVVKLLLADDRVTPDSKDKFGRTLLSWAAGNGHEAVVKLLLADNRVDPESKDTKYGQTPLSWAAGNGHEAVVKLLLADDRVDPDSKDTKYGQTPLSWAAQNGHEAVVKLLLADNRVDPDSKDTEYGQTPLSWAAENGRKAVVELLLADNRVDSGSKDKFGRMPLLWAAENGHEAVVKLLLTDDRVDPDSKDTEYGQTPLSWAAKNGHKAVVKLLLTDNRVDPDSMDTEYGGTPLSWAA